MAEYTPTVYRITRKMLHSLIDGEVGTIFNSQDIYLEDIKRHLNKQFLMRIASPGLNRMPLGVYVNSIRQAGTAHHLLPYNYEYQNEWGNQPLYGNIIMMVRDKTYNELPAELKTTDITTIRM